MIRELRLAYFVSLLCRVLEVTTSGYYAWVKRPLTIRQREEMRLELEIRAAHKRTRQTYGPERLQRDLADNGVVVGVHRIKRIRRKLGLRCRQKRKFKVTTDSRHSLPVAGNLLNQKFEASAPNQIWLSDIRASGPFRRVVSILSALTPVQDVANLLLWRFEAGAIP